MEQKGFKIHPVLNIDRLYTAFTAHYDSTFYFPGESHDFWELDAILDGRSGVTSATEIYDCGAGEVVIHPPGVFHTARASGARGVSVLTISFSAPYAERHIPAGKFILNERERALLGLLREELERDGGKKTLYSVSRENEQMVKNLLEALCLSLNRRRAESATPERAEQAALFSEVAGWMQQHVDDALSVADVCTACGVGRTTLKNLFHRYASMGVMQYYNHLRVRRAVALMSEGHGMAQIAEIMHFSSQNYFSDFFRRETGIPPSRYTKQ